VPSKPSPEERERGYVEDAIGAIDAIRGFIAGIGFDAFDNDDKTMSAVERKLFIIAEVIGRIGRFEELYPRAHQVRGLANRLRHQYDRIDSHVIWDAITGTDLMELREAFVNYPSA
jgi:uncharacterized protein with HEPN domain